VCSAGNAVHLSCCIQELIAECPAVPGCVSQGKTEAEAEANVQDAIKQCLEVRAEMGMPLTVFTRQVEVTA
jgi:predicted RNase H-like HicB family nuclease